MIFKHFRMEKMHDGQCTILFGQCTLYKLTFSMVVVMGPLTPGTQSEAAKSNLVVLYGVVSPAPWLPITSRRVLSWPLV